MINANSDIDLRKKIFETFAKEGITIFEMKKSDVTLEDAFMQLIDSKNSELKEAENTESVEKTENTENTENTESAENVERTENVEKTENVEDTERSREYRRKKYRRSKRRRK